jgi:hypothetical protein
MILEAFVPVSRVVFFWHRTRRKALANCPRTAHCDGDGNSRAREITDVRAEIGKDTRRKH